MGAAYKTETIPMNYTILEKIKSPEDIKTLTRRELSLLAQQMRHIILQTVSSNGGHLASNLGVIELTIALHRVFSCPNDAIIWDVGHQSYAHKLLTGRYGQFSTLRLKDGLSGFPKREESPFDVFNTGHASTSVSAAMGILAGKSLQQKNGKVIAVIGDGALTGGMAFEALLNLSDSVKNLVVILNDNKMSISPNTSAISKYLSRLAINTGYRRFRYLFDTAVGSIPFIGKRLNTIIRRLKLGIKGIFYTSNFFVDLGFQYVGPLNGHHEYELEKVFRNVKHITAPVLVHIQTKKGKGYGFAEDNPSDFHGIGPFSLADGKVEKKQTVSFTEAFSESLVKNAETNDDIIAVTAAMAQGTGLNRFQHRYPNRFFDVGIAEQHAVTFAAGLAVTGLRPVVALYSTFLQRAIDQIIHDVALQNLPVVFAVDRAGAVPDDGETHQGWYDISLLRTIPHISILAPAAAAEMQLMLNYALCRNSPVVIRYPKAVCACECPAFAEPLVHGRGVMALKTGKSTVLLVCTGGIYAEVKKAADLLVRAGIFADIYNLRFLKPLDEDFFVETAKPYKTVCILEEGAYIGGTGAYLELLLKNHTAVQTMVIAFPDAVFQHGSRDDILYEAGLTGNRIAETVRSGNFRNSAQTIS